MIKFLFSDVKDKLFYKKREHKCVLYILIYIFLKYKMWVCIVKPNDQRMLEGFWSVTYTKFFVLSHKSFFSHCTVYKSCFRWSLKSQWTHISLKGSCVVCACMQWSDREEWKYCGRTIIHFIQAFIFHLFSFIQHYVS